MRADWLDDIAREVGVNASILPGYETRGASMSSIEAIVWHATATGLNWSDLRVAELLRDGRTGANALAGPLAQMGPARDGTFWLVASGRCNHNGYGQFGNQTLGLEFFNPNDGTPLTDAQLTAGYKMTAGILRKIGRGPERLFDHKGTDPRRKVDVVGLRMENVRAAVALHMLTQSGYVAPKPKPIPTSFTVQRRGLRLVAMKEPLMRLTLTTQLDEFGRGWVPLDGKGTGATKRPKVPEGTLISANPQGSHPLRDKGYWPIPEIGENSEAGNTVITIEGGVPSGPATIFLVVPDAA